MAKIELSISADYAHNWTSLDGVREIIQNGIDSETSGNTLRIEYREATETLAIINDGVELERAHLLLGVSAKRGNSDQIGQYGEGMKVGILALIRAGHKVLIRTGAETWTPSIEESRQFGGVKVLTWDIAKGRKHFDGIEVKIRAVISSMWAQICDRTLRLKGEVSSVKVANGEILFGDDEKGRIYVRGLYVCRDSNFALGYSFNDVELDRDRRVIDGWTLQYAAAAAVASAYNAGELSIETLLRDNAYDIQGVSPYQINEAQQEKLLEDFRSKHGEKAFPCDNAEQANELNHVGGIGVVVAAKYGEILRNIIGISLEDYRTSLMGKVVRIYDANDLTDDENSLLATLLMMFGRTAASVAVVDFAGPTVGLWENSTVKIARGILDNPANTAATLLHEFAHDYGRDTQTAHKKAIQGIAGEAIARACGFIA